MERAQGDLVALLEGDFAGEKDAALRERCGIFSVLFLHAHWSTALLAARKQKLEAQTAPAEPRQHLVNVDQSSH
jgi:hypothetical protein